VIEPVLQPRQPHQQLAQLAVAQLALVERSQLVDRGAQRPEHAIVEHMFDPWRKGFIRK
jgi:hypothetical protein